MTHTTNQFGHYDDFDNLIEQCAENTASGRRCSRRATLRGYCHQHYSDHPVRLRLNTPTYGNADGTVFAKSDCPECGFAMATKRRAERDGGDGAEHITRLYWEGAMLSAGLGDRALRVPKQCPPDAQWVDWFTRTLDEAMRLDAWIDLI